MIVRFHNRGAGGGSGPVGYLTGDIDHAGKERDVAPEILQGDPDLTRELIDSLDFKSRYTSGCLSFSEPDLTPKQKQRIMDTFEQALLPGMDKDQYNVLWVEHRDKGRLELNFVIPKTELTTGKQLTPYYAKADQKRINAWQNITNAKHGLTDPNDPEHRRLYGWNPNRPDATKADAKTITDHLRGQIEAGYISNRAEIVAELAECGLEVARESKSSISIKNPSGERNIRLKGAIYERTFGTGAEAAATLERSRGEYQAGRASRLRADRRDYYEGAGRRRKFLQCRYGGAQKEGQEANQNDLAAALVALSDNGWSAGRSDLLADEYDIGSAGSSSSVSRARIEGSANPVRKRKKAMREDRSECAGMGGESRVANIGGVLDDQARAAASERVRELVRAAFDRGRAVAEHLRRISAAARVQLRTARQAGEAGAELERCSGGVECSASRLTKQLKVMMPTKDQPRGISR